MAGEVRLLVVDPRDNVGTTLSPAAAGDSLVLVGAVESPPAPRLVALTDLPAGHKAALAALPSGGEVRKYGAVIGLATEPIAPGELVHVHNLKSARGKGHVPGREEEA